MPADLSLRSASLDDPLYYLANLQAVIRWVLDHHSDLLIETEQLQLTSLLALPEPAQALLARMILRKGEYFRDDALVYEEIPDLGTALAQLADNGLLDADPVVPIEALFRLCRRAELQQLLKQADIHCAAGAKKADYLALLEDMVVAEPDRRLAQWWPQASFRVVKLCCQPLFDRLRVMFFGNNYQDWSEFVLTELGYQRYEAVAFSAASRAFQCREDVDVFLALAHCQQRLDENGDSREALEHLPLPSANAWLAYRRDKLLFRLAWNAERQGDSALALSLYRGCELEEALVRRFRLLEKSVTAPALLDELESVLAMERKPLTRLHLQRVEQRARRKAGLPKLEVAGTAVREETLQLPEAGEQRVEFAVADWLAQQHQLDVFYTENTLFPGLLALLCWPVLFEPLSGAFFNPFQSGPADLFRDDFVERRAAQLDEQLAALDSGDYRKLITDCWEQKRGIACALINWEVLDRELLALSLELIPASHLHSIFRHLLKDLRQHRSGMPDLTVFDRHSGSYRLIEVKGPGDRLQDHQRLWLEAMGEMGVPVSVMSVRYGDEL